MVPKLLFAAVIVWVFGYQVFVKEVGLAGTVFAAGWFHLAGAILLILAMFAVEISNRLRGRNESQRFGIGTFLTGLVVAAGVAALYWLATDGYRIVRAKTGDGPEGILLIGVLLVAFVLLCHRFAPEPVRRMFGRFGKKGE
jgi:hypothetical protein